METKEQSKVNLMTFGEALIEMKKGNKVKRSLWAGKSLGINRGVANLTFLGFEVDDSGNPVKEKQEKSSLMGAHISLFRHKGDSNSITMPRIVVWTSSDNDTLQNWGAPMEDIICDDWVVLD